MERMVRKQIYLEPRQDQQLKRMVKETGLSEAELIRSALDAQAHSSLPIVLDPSAWRAERLYLEKLIALGPEKGGRTWRREDLHER